jgi:hypothetical protein
VIIHAPVSLPSLLIAKRLPDQVITVDATGLTRTGSG